MRRISGRPSPAMAVAFIALLAALSGTAVALPGKNTVDSGDIKKGNVKSSDLAANAVRGGKVRNGSLTGADSKDNSLTGADVDESTLGQVPSEHRHERDQRHERAERDQCEQRDQRHECAERRQRRSAGWIRLDRLPSIRRDDSLRADDPGSARVGLRCNRRWSGDD
jgi:hypothetical protein